jgi:alpha-L-fucosidase
VLYLHVFERPASGEIVLPGLGSEPMGASWMEAGAPAVEMRRAGTDLVLRLPDALPDSDCSVIALQLAEAPVVYRDPEIRAAVEQFVGALAVELACPSSQLQLRFTLDGSEPSAQSAAYESPLSLAATTTVRVRAFHAGRPVTRTIERTFRKVEPRPAIAADGAQPGLRMEQFAGTWDRLPDFSSLPMSVTQTVNEIGPAVRTEFVGRRFSGLVRVASSELYEFALACDDGGKLWIDGELVIDNDGLHGMRERTGSIALATGHHALRIEWFNRSGGSELSVRMRPLGGDFQPLSSEALSHLP